MGKILLIDDEKSIRITMKAFFEGHGHQVKVAESGMAGILHLEKEDTDVVICDILLPQMSGIEVLKYVRQNWPLTEMIMVTGGPSAEMSAEIVRLGAFDYLFKPVDKQKLLLSVENAIDARQINSELQRLQEENIQYQKELEKLVETRSEDLIRSRKSLSEAQEIAHLGSWAVIPGSRRIEWSSELFRILGFRPKSFRPTMIRFVRSIHPDDRERVLRMIRNAVGGPRSFTAEFRIMKMDQSVCHVHLRAKPEEFEGNVVKWIGTVQDVTESRNAETVLREKEQILRIISENYPNSILYLVEKDMLVSYSSGQEYQRTGTDPSSVVGKPIGKAFGKHGALVSKHCRQSFLGKECSFELQHNGQQCLLKTVPLRHPQDEIDRILLVEENVTDRRAAEIIQQDRDQRIRSIFNRLNDAVFVHPVMENGYGVFTEVNEMACKRYGYTREELLTMTLNDVSRGGGSDNAESKVVDPIRSSSKSGIFHMTLRDKYGNAFPVEISSSMVVMDSQPYILSVVRDMTERDT